METWASEKTFLELHEKRARRGSGAQGSLAVADGGVELGIARLLISTALTLEP